MRSHPPDYVLVLALAIGIFLWQRTVFPLWMVDLSHIQIAAYEFGAGETEWMYAPADRLDAWKAHVEPTARRLGVEGNLNAYFYQPVIAAVLSPLAGARATIWRDVLFFINIALLGVFAYQILRLCSVSLTLRTFLWALTLVLLAYPMARATKLAQIVPLLAAGMWAAILLLRSGRQRAAGLILGIIGAIKLFPLGLVLDPLLQRKWRPVAWCAGTLIAFYAIPIALLGWEIHAAWWEAVRDFSSVVYCYFGNQALTAWFARAVLGYDLLHTQIVAPLIVRLLRAFCIAVFGGLTVWILWKRNRDPVQEVWMPRIGLLSSGILLSLPVVWDHYLLFVLPALGWAIHDVWSRGDRRFWELWLAVSTFFFCMKLTRFYTDSPLGHIVSGSQAAGLLMLWIWFARRMWARMKSAVRAPARA